MMTRNATANQACRCARSDEPSDAMRRAMLWRIHVRRPFCLFGHVTPHETNPGCPGWALRHYNHADLAVDL